MFNQLVIKSCANLLRAGQIVIARGQPHHRLLSSSISIQQHDSLLLPPNQHSQHQQIRTLKLWKEKTVRLMYWRGKDFDKEPEKLRARSEWQDWNYTAEVYAFAQRLGEGKDLTEEALTRAFTHRSYLSAQQAKQQQLGIEDVQMDLMDNVELIEEGRALIEQYSQRYLRYFLRSAPEECIRSLSGYLLSEPVLADISKWIGCIDLIFCAEFPPNGSTLADTVAAVVGTIARECGPKRAENFILDFILTYLNGADLLEVWPLHQLDLDLNQYLRSRGQPEAEPRILHRSAVGTIEACYVVGLYQEKKLIGQGPGESLQIARRMAELDALRNLFCLTAGQVRFEFGVKGYNLNLAQYDKDNYRLIEEHKNRTKTSKVASN